VPFAAWAGYSSRLERPLEELVPAPVLVRMRRLRLALTVGGAIGLIPWVFLVIAVPAKCVALGFDVLLVAFVVTRRIRVPWTQGGR
jgi:hypothetical protein